MTWVPIATAAASAVAILGAGGALTDIGPWYRGMRRPSWTPPDWAFAPAWTLIFGLAAWAGVLAWEGAPDQAGRTLVIVLAAVNGVLNVVWSVLFFRLRRPDWALMEVVLLWCAVLAPMLLLARFDALVPLLLAPYLVWVTYASTVNWGYVRLNAPFGRREPRAA